MNETTATNEGKTELKKPYPDIMATRYASAKMVNLWHETNIIIQRRRLWIAILKAQMEQGMIHITPEAIANYEAMIYKIDLESIKKRELIIRQDVVAQIKEFNHLAGHELIHTGFTSRDITDNVEQMMIRDSLAIVRDCTVAVLQRLGSSALKYSEIDICGRSHLMVGQTTTEGKRFTNLAQEMLIAYDHLIYVMSSYPLRGIKGAMGTQQDLLALLGNDPEKVAKFEESICRHLSFSRVMDSVGQVYPRSLDFEVVSALFQLASAASNFAKMVRLMAGLDLGHEGFKEGRTGSSAMPHKMNSSTSERINGLLGVLRGYLAMIESLVGDQWFEGDVSCSVVRRVALPGAFFAIDGIFESTLTVLDEMELYPEMISFELEQYLPFLSTTRLLIEMVKKGIGRETAHDMIKKHAVAGLKAKRSGQPNSFIEGLLSEPNFPLDPQLVKEIISKPNHGLADKHVEKIVARILQITSQHPKAATYKPAPQL